MAEYYSRRAPQAISSLESQTDLPFEVYDRVVAEPTEASWRDAIAWARQHDCSHFLAYAVTLSFISQLFTIRIAELAEEA